MSPPYLSCHCSVEDLSASSWATALVSPMCPVRGPSPSDQPSSTAFPSLLLLKNTTLINLSFS